MTFTPDYKPATVIPSPNYWASRQGYMPQVIVLHGTAGLAPGCVEWLASPQSGASVHYLVERTGLVIQLVREDWAAWGNGIPEPPSPYMGGANPNLFSVSCETERDQTNTSPVTDAQKASLIALCRDIRSRYGPLPIIPHSAISPQSRAHCPGDGYPLAEIDQASTHPGPSDITWIRFSGKPQRTPIIFYADASFMKPLYMSAATRTTVLHFDGWRNGAPVVDVVTKQNDVKWFHRNNVNGQRGWVPSGWIDGNPGDAP